MKIIAFYLPQFHVFSENELWWGEGFTEWTNVKTAKPLFEGHDQPRVPLNNNYYNLLEVDTIKKQARLAKQYGIYGFCYYHYWFDGKLLMEKPIKMMLNDKSIDLPFCISWANEDWTRQWAKKSKEVLISQNYGEQEEWINHFNYLLPFFKDERYIKIDNEPLIIIYRPELIDKRKEMVALWKKLAVKNGFTGLKVAYQQIFYNHRNDKNGDIFDYGIEYQPGYVRKAQQKTFSLLFRKTMHEFIMKLQLPQSKLSTIVYDYDDTWKRILNIVPRDEKMMPGAFIDWDNTPRYKERASVTVGFSPEKFEKYLTKQIRRAKEVYKKDYIFLFAWNEWGEGGYLEPDISYGNRKLEAIRNSLKNNNC